MPRLRVYSTEAIPIKRMDFGEADRLLTVITPRDGKLRLLAKGVRRPTSRMAGHLELFAHVQLMVARGRNLDIATQASTVEPFQEVREDLVLSSFAYHLAELVDLFVQDSDTHTEVFDLFLGGLQALTVGSVPRDLIARHFEMHILGATGFAPELTSCLSCGAEIVPGENFYSPPMGGVYCPQCRYREPSVAPIALDSLKLLRYLQRVSSWTSLSVRPPEITSRDVERLLRRQIELVLERRLRTPEFVRRVAEEAAVYRG